MTCSDILLAAHPHSLGSCWVAGDKKPYAAEICGLVGVPPAYKLISLIPIGYPAENPMKSNPPCKTSCSGKSTESVSPYLKTQFGLKEGGVRTERPVSPGE